jgi:hypothetical protein
MNRTMHGFLAIALLVGPVLAQAAVVTVGNREWRQLTETTGFSWNEVSTVCNSTTGVCNGSLGPDGSKVDFTGWNWAANSDVQGLFNAQIGNFFATATTDYKPGVIDNSQIAAFMADGFFLPTQTAGARRVIGFSRTPERLGQTVLAPDVQDATNQGACDFGPNFCDAAFLNRNYGLTSKEAAVGAWLYRDASPVPLPGALLLFGSGLATLLGLARKRSGKTAAV